MERGQKMYATGTLHGSRQVRYMVVDRYARGMQLGMQPKTLAVTIYFI